MLLFLIFFCVSVCPDKSMILHASVSFTSCLVSFIPFLGNWRISCHRIVFQSCNEMLFLHISISSIHFSCNAYFELNATSFDSLLSHWFMMFVAVEGSLKSVKRRETKTSNSHCLNLNVLLWEKSRLWRRWHKMKFICFSSLISSPVNRSASFSYFTSWFVLKKKRKKKKPRGSD